MRVHKYRIYCIIMGFYRLHASHVAEIPDLEGSVPRGRVQKQRDAIDGHGRDGVDVLDPQTLVVPPDLNVSLAEDKVTQVVGGGGQCLKKLVDGAFRIWAVPNADFIVFVSSEDGVICGKKSFNGEAANAEAGAFWEPGSFENEGISGVETSVEETASEAKR